MDIRKIALWIGIFCGAWSVAAPAGVEGQTTALDEETSPAASKTYIESGPFGLIKIEIPTPGRVLDKMESARGKGEHGGEQVDFSVLPLMELHVTTDDPGALFEIGVLRIPFARLWSVEGRKAIFVPSDRNPFHEGANSTLWEQPLFCFYDTALLFDNTKGQERGHSLSSAHARRSRWLDTPLVSLWEMEKWNYGKYHRYKFLDFLPVATIAGEKGKSRSSFEVLDTSLVSVFGYENEEKKDNATGHVRSLYTCVASVWESRWKEGKKEWSFLAAPLCGGAKWRAEGEKERLTILGTESMDSRLPGRGGAPLTALWHQQREGKDTSTQQFLRVPLIGPVWAAWEDKDEARWGIFPRLFFWKKFRY